MGDLKSLTGKEVNEGIEDGVGGTCLTGAGIDFYRLQLQLAFLSEGQKIDTEVAHEPLIGASSGYCECSVLKYGVGH